MKALWAFIRDYWRWLLASDKRLAETLDRLAAVMNEYATRAKETARAIQEFGEAMENMERLIDEQILDELLEQRGSFT